jgi:tetratricopeptide (TPR) repeat protein
VKRWRLSGVVLLCAAAACGPERIPPPDPSIAARVTLAGADALLRVGCFDCLTSALDQYESVRPVLAVRAAATAGALRASALLALRERELGTTDSGYLEKARSLAASDEALQRDVAPLLEIIGITLWRAGAGRTGAPDQPLTIYQNRVQRLEMLRPLAARDELSAYVWLAYACETSSARIEISEILAPIDAERAMSDLPLLAFRRAICLGVDAGAVEALAAREPRFAELAYFRGLVASAERKLDEAEARYREAYGWRATWPAATLLIANVAMTGEEFATALEFYEKTLDLAPSFPDALLGKLRSLSYLERHEDALAVADELLALHRYPGDAYYWRAANELQLNRLDAAWSDIESADKAMVNSDVPKLAGVIEMRRRELDVARRKLETARQRNPNDCEAGYYLQLVLGDLAKWPALVEVAVGTAGCLDDAEAFARQDIDRIGASTLPEARKARQIARRRQQIESAVRMRATCWYNAAVANFNLSRPEEARRYADKVAGDEQFGERARDLAGRIKK